MKYTICTISISDHASVNLITELDIKMWTLTEEIKYAFIVRL